MTVHEQNGDFDQGRVYVDEDEYKRLSIVDCRLSMEDLVLITGFTPAEITIKSQTNDQALINLLQNNYYGWKATVDGKPVDVCTGNLSFLAVPVPAGEHEVVFSYDPKIVKVGFWISLVALASSIILLLLLRVRKEGFH
jgi:uncharacterized membrane protein YfhO